jgi:hypothetical protein
MKYLPNRPNQWETMKRREEKGREMVTKYEPHILKGRNSWESQF